MRLNRFPHLLTLMVLAASLLTTYAVWNYAERQARNELQTEFEFHVRETTTKIQQRMSAYVQVLYGLRALFNGSDRVTRDEFRAYITSLRLQEQYPGIQGLSHAPLIANDQLEAHIAEIREQSAGDKVQLPPNWESDYETWLRAVGWRS